VLITLKEWHEGEKYPAISGNNRLWSDAYGIYVVGAISELHAPIMAEYIDWTPNSVKCGPAPIGSGSGINAASLSLRDMLDVIDIWPWSGFVKHSEDDNPLGPTVGIYQMSSDPGFDWDQLTMMANVFRENADVEPIYTEGETYFRGDVIKHFVLPGLASRRDFLPEIPLVPTSGLDYGMLENVDLAWIDSHGMTAPESYEGGHDNGDVYGYICIGKPDLFYPDQILELGFDSVDVRSDQIEFGGYGLRWAVLDGCRLMARDSQCASRFGGSDGISGIEGITSTSFSPEDYYCKADLDTRYKAHTIGNGLHLLLGHATTSSIGDVHCKYFAQMVTGRYPEYDQRKIVDAYLDVNSLFQPYDSRVDVSGDSQTAIWSGTDGVGAFRYGALTVAYGASDCMEDMFQTQTSNDPGMGSETSRIYRSSDQPAEVNRTEDEMPLKPHASWPSPELQVELLDTEQEGSPPTSTLEPDVNYECRLTLDRTGWKDLSPSGDEPGPIQDAAIWGEWMPVDSSGNPLDDLPTRIACAKYPFEDQDRYVGTVLVHTPAAPGRYKLRIINSRTWYWGSPGILEVQEQP
jgi:hypothetical protein